MKKTMLKFFGFFMTVFTVTQASQVDKVHAHSPQLNSSDKPTYTTDEHGGGCCCNTCSAPIEELSSK